MSSLYPIRYIIVGMVFTLCALLIDAQRFNVSAFRLLANDVTAFVTPVHDLNGDGCALIKIQASPEFAFSTPLGIVKREDNVGEVWLYVPARSKKITIKHPQWGVLRDYIFPVKIESHFSYEMRIEEPENIISANSILPESKIIHDTLIVMRTDTMMIRPQRKKVPFNASIIATVGFGGNSRTVTGGILAVAMRRHGAFFHVTSDFGKIGHTKYSCDRDGVIDNRTPYYSGKTRHATLTACIGPAHRLSSVVSIFEGIGYGYDRTAWELAASEGGGYAKNSHLSKHGISFEAGMIISLHRLNLSASVISIGGKRWFGSLGIGIKIGK